MTPEQLIAQAREYHSREPGADAGDGTRSCDSCGWCKWPWPCDAIQLADALDGRLKHEEFVSRDANARHWYGVAQRAEKVVTAAREMTRHPDSNWVLRALDEALREYGEVAK